MKLVYFKIVVFSILVSACSTTAGTTRPSGIPIDTYNELQVSTEVNLDFSDLRRTSCRASEGDQSFQSLAVEFKPTQPFDLSKLPDGVSFVGGWQLKPGNRGPHSLSGLHALSDDTLLAISEEGAFLRIGLRDNQPTGSVEIADMLDESGLPMRGSYLADAEGVTSKDGLVFVAFEQFHRVDAYALNECGSLARPARVAALPKKLRGVAIEPNSGPQAIGWHSNLVIFYEKMSGHGALGMTLGSEERTDYFALELRTLERKLSSPVVGMTNEISSSDERDGWQYRLRRGLNEFDGFTFAIEVSHSFTSPMVSGDANFLVFELQSPTQAIDLEGIAVQKLQNGKHRIWMVSNNNGLDRNPTLLFAFDIEPTYRTDGPGGRTVV
ncbi:esterase-like activity of phytase family protein [Hyphomonas oceanitis]|uniref:esterase-like activity of phytase family protein n=1 Tax=Hyphomonas oceanitis TaxID=81033 RepID=UPI003001178C